jgi:hypothetical protein
MAVHVGDRGTAVTALRPQGLVRIAGERHDARSEGGYIEAESEIVVINGDQLGLIVRRVEPGQTVKLPNHGREVFGSFGAKVEGEGAREDAKQAQWVAERKQYGFRAGAVLGMIAASVGVALLWPFIEEQSNMPWVVAAAAVIGGIVWGVVFFRGIDSALQEIGGDYWRFTTISAIAGLAAGTAGAVWVIPTAGPGWGAVVAFGAMLTLAALAPILGMLFELLTGGGDGG